VPPAKYQSTPKQKSKEGGLYLEVMVPIKFPSNLFLLWQIASTPFDLPPLIQLFHIILWQNYFITSDFIRHGSGSQNLYVELWLLPLLHHKT